MENKSSNGWKFFALLFGGLLAALVGLYIYKQQNPDYDPWEEPWENSSSPVDLGLNKAEDEDNARSRKLPRPRPDTPSLLSTQESPAMIYRRSIYRLRGFLVCLGRLGEVSPPVSFADIPLIRGG